MTLGEDLQLAYLLSYLEWPLVFQGVPADLGVWDKAMSESKEVWR